MTRETRQPVECACCGWTGKRMTGQIVMCPKCGGWATFVWTPDRHETPKGRVGDSVVSGCELPPSPHRSEGPAGSGAALDRG